ncbi:MAG: hypothetical protein EOP67_48220, partial [Sphingomonas sp.]
MTTLARMTVNERLEAMGRLEQWNAAVEARDLDAMVQLLRRVPLFEPAHRFKPLVDRHPRQRRHYPSLT